MSLDAAPNRPVRVPVTASRCRSLTISALLLAAGWMILNHNGWGGLEYFAVLAGLEAGAALLVGHLRKGFQWLITTADRTPHMDPVALERFTANGFDPELGWVRKSGNQKEEISHNRRTQYRIGPEGCRANPGHEGLPRRIACYGDSFVFARQVNDNETFAWQLSRMTGTDVMNFGVGNYGLDQAFLRLQREYPAHPTPMVVMGVVPSTIVRILCVWKHYNEFGNVFGFKPRYVIKDGAPRLVPNIMDHESKFLRYREYLPQIQAYDDFYRTKFENELIRFPYFPTLLASPLCHPPLLAAVAWDRWVAKSPPIPYPRPMSLIMRRNLKLRKDLFRRRPEAVALLEGLVSAFSRYGRENGFVPIFLWMPQKDDVLEIREGVNYYAGFIERIRSVLPVIDLTPHWAAEKDLDRLYCDDNRYGGHHTPLGNRIIAEILISEIPSMDPPAVSGKAAGPNGRNPHGDFPPQKGR